MIKYRKPLVNILNEVINSIDWTVQIKGYTNNHDGTHILKVCDMFHAQPGFDVTIDDVKYQIIEIVPGSKEFCGRKPTFDFIHIKGNSDDIIADRFQMYRPFFFYGTPLQQEVENKAKKAQNKIPMFWLNWGTLNENFTETEMDNIERTSSIELYALTQSDHAKWQSEKFKENAVDPMQRMMEALINQIKSMMWLFDQYTLESRIEPMQRFGVYIDNKGFEKRQWTDQLSGVKLTSTLTIFTDESCEICDDVSTPAIPDMIIEDTFIVQ